MGVQVEELTRNLMPWGKEYIDFSFAGRHISEFGLVVVTNGDRYQFAGSPEFEDETSNVNGVWGQYYWGTNYKTKTYSYSLATDGMTERQFEEFKYHFRPGHYGQFYEDTWFDRYCYVRLKAVVDFSFIPFQKEVEVAGVKFPSRVYKGECKISFIQDRPFMHSFYQVLDSKIADLSTNNDNSKAAVRMMYHSNIPARDSWTKEVKCATGSQFSLPVIKKANISQKDKQDNLINITPKEQQQDEDISPIYSLASKIPYYNPSTMKSEALINFTLDRLLTTVKLNNWQPVYFTEIYDEFTNKKSPYNTISSTDKIQTSSGALPNNPRYIYKYKYGLPEVSSDVNKAINVAWIFYQENIRGALAELQNRLQEELINSRVLSWAIKILQKIQTNQVLYKAVGQNQEELNDNFGILIDAQDDGFNNISLDSIQKASEEVVGEIIFHSGDYEDEEYSSFDKEGCLRPNKIKVYVLPISKEPFMVDWFGYFNIMMLLMFGKFDGTSVEDITSPNTFSSFYPCNFVFDGQHGLAKVSYFANYIYDSKITKEEEILDENCSNIIASEYLKMEGGDTIDISTGKIASYHILGFNRGEDESIQVKNLKLEYKYTYV